VYEDGGAAMDIDIKIQKARGAFSRLRRIWQSAFIHKDTKIKIFNACVKSVLLYGCQTWLVTSCMYPKKTSILFQPMFLLHSKDVVAKNYLQWKTVTRHWEIWYQYGNKEAQVLMDWTYAQKERCWTIKGCPPVESPGYKKERKTEERLAKICAEWMWE
jgi:hypothetical protein